MRLLEDVPASMVTVCDLWGGVGQLQQCLCIKFATNTRVARCAADSSQQLRIEAPLLQHCRRLAAGSPHRLPHHHE